MAQQESGRARTSEERAYRDLEELLRDGVRDAACLIWRNRNNLLVMPKPPAGDRTEDLYTNVDLMAQDLLVRRIQGVYPDAGMLAEERGHTYLRANGINFTVDGTDGTYPLIWGNLHGVSSMASAALAGSNEVIAVGIAHATTRDTFSYGPESSGVTHCSGRVARILPDSPDAMRSLSECRVLMRRELTNHLSVTQRLVAQAGKQLVTDDSYGVSFPRQWKREIAISVLPHSGMENPWDVYPVYGIAKKLNYAFLRTTKDGEALERYDPVLPVAPRLRGHDTIVMHENDLSLIESFLR